MQVTVTVPYSSTINHPEDVVLDPSSHDEARAEGAALELLEEISVGGYEGGEVERIITSAAALYAMRAGTIWQCLDTAAVWERG